MKPITKITDGTYVMPVEWPADLTDIDVPYCNSIAMSIAMSRGITPQEPIIDFTFIVDTTKTTTFAIGTSATLNGKYHTANWIIDWGDGVIESRYSSGSASSYISHIYPERNSLYEVKIKPQNPIELGWLRAFGSNATSRQWAEIVEIRGTLTPDMVRETETDSNVCVGMFANFINLKISDSFSFSDNFKTVGDTFCANMFNGCTNLIMGNKFTIPGKMKNAGSNLCSNMFSGCTNLILGERFNLPSIFDNIGYGGFYSMFYNCKTTLLNNIFSLPNNINVDARYFANDMFSGCANIKIPESFTILKDMITSTGDRVLYNTFYNCTNIQLPDNFTLPQKLTSVGNEFCYRMFGGCRYLNLNSKFNLPQKLTTVGDSFCYGMFYNCYDATLNNDFTLPPDIISVGHEFCRGMFSNSSPTGTPYTLIKMNSKFNLPQKLTTVGDYFCENMFGACREMTMNTIFNLPPNLKNVGSNFCASMFYLNRKFIVNSIFRLPQNLETVSVSFCQQMFYDSGIITGVSQIFGNLVLESSELNKASVYAFTFRKSSSLNEDLTVIPQLQEIPTARKYTFYESPAAIIAPLHTNWK